MHNLLSKSLFNDKLIGKASQYFFKKNLKNPILYYYGEKKKSLSTEIATASLQEASQ
jgi:hypothetical protein